MNLRGHVKGFVVGAAAALGIVGAVAMWPFVSAEASVERATGIERIAAEFGVTIVWTSATPCELISPHADGCFTASTPDTIYITPEASLRHREYLVLHELGHVVQNRMRRPLDECEADRFAQAIGSTGGAYCALTN